MANISIRWLGEILHRYKVRLRRTKTWKESTDPMFVRKYRAIHHLYRQRPAGGRRLVMDNYGTHVMATIQAWAQSHNVHIYLTPTNGSSLKDTTWREMFQDINVSDVSAAAAVYNQACSTRSGRSICISRTPHSSDSSRTSACDRWGGRDPDQQQRLAEQERRCCTGSLAQPLDELLVHTAVIYKDETG